MYWPAKVSDQHWLAVYKSITNGAFFRRRLSHDCIVAGTGNLQPEGTIKVMSEVALSAA